MHEIARAKINLALHVRGRMPDGYHAIETIFAFAEHGDRIEARESEALALDVTGPFAAALAREPDNLMLRAARALRDRYGVERGAHLILEKNLPVAAGLGGGSADAAATLRLLSRWWALDLDEPDLIPIAAALGADVPACILERPVRGDGRGDELTWLDADESLLGKPMLLVNPARPLPTGEVFSGWDGVDRGPLEDWRNGRNDLEPAAIARVPEIADALAALGGAEVARMSGSGASCFGLYAGEAERDSDADALAAARPNWWILRTHLH